MTWGFHARISIYVEGERDSALAIAATQAAAKVFTDAGRVVQFGGATVLPVHDEPMGR